MGTCGATVLTLISLFDSSITSDPTDPDGWNDDVPELNAAYVAIQRHIPNSDGYVVPKHITADTTWYAQPLAHTYMYTPCVRALVGMH